MRNRVADQAATVLLLLAAALTLSAAVPVRADTVPGTPIANTASASYRIAGVPYTVVSPADVVVVDSMPPGSTTARLELLRYDPTAYRADSGSFVPIPPPPAPDGTSGTVVDVVLGLSVANAYRGTEIVFVRIVDEDRNTDYTAADTVEVRLEILGVGDAELLRLTETGPSTGEFLGYLEIDATAGVGADGTLGAGSNATLRVSYVDPADPIDAHQGTALIDPRGIVFDSSTGLPVDGVTVWLLDELGGAPATVYGSDGSSSFPASVVTGSTVVDGAGTSYALAPGEFLFPVVPRGRYTLAVGLPDDAGFVWPTARTDGELLALPGGPFAVATGSRGEVFDVGAEPVRVDLPIDPLAAALFVGKTADREVVSPGDFFRYTVKLTSTRTVGPIADVRIEDRLPTGFRYQAGSARWSAPGPAEPVVGADGRTLEWRVPSLAPGATIDVRYVVEAAVPVAGKAASTAQAFSAELVSNVARAIVVVEDDLRRDRTLILGRVTVHESDTPTAEGLAGVRILLEDGSYTLTDDRGAFRLEDVTAGSHVVQLDVATLPPGYRAVLPDDELLAAGSALSRFVDLQGGSAWRVEFHVERSRNDTADGRAATVESESEPANDDAPATFDRAWLERQPAGWQWLLPLADARPDVPSLRVVVKHPPGSSFEVRLNGEPIDPLNRDGTIVAAGARVAASIWSGVDLLEGESTIEVIRLDASGGEIDRERRTVYLAGPPVRAEVVEERSTLVADGRTPPVIAVRLFDRHGRPAREGLTGPFFVDEPYLPARADDYELALLPGARAERARFVVGPDGIASLGLQPTTLSGRVQIRLPLAAGDAEVRADLRDQARDWVLVGIAEGEIGHGTLVDHVEPLSGSDEADTYDDGRVAFYAKGRVRGGWILSAAYDSAKTRADRSALHDTIDPGAYYLVYSETEGRRPGAASSEKLYLKLERRALAMLFGDYHLNWTVTELAAYRRDLTGAHVTHSGRRLRAEAFASDTAQTLQRDDLPGRGTSGPYRLSGGEIVLFSESVSVEVRDRFRSEIVVSRRPLSRTIDYTIDYDVGTVMLRETLFTTDVALNPQFLVVTYETESGEDDRVTFGARMELEAAPGVRIGATHIDESEHDGRDLTGLDARVKLGGRTELRAEIAQTHDPATGEDEGAYLAEVAHIGERLQATAYVRQRDERFGLGQLSAAERGTRKIAVEGSYRLDDRLTVRGLAAREDQLGSDASRERVETSAEYHGGPWRLQGGFRGVDDRLPGGAEQRSRLVTAGAARSLFDERLRLRVDHEENLSGGTESLDFPNRTRLGLDYRLSPSAELFAEQEWTDGALRETRQLRTGIKSRPWQGAQAFGTLNRAAGDVGSLSAAAGLRQRWNLTPSLSADIGFEHSRELGASSASSEFGRPTASAPGGDSTAAATALTWKPGPWIYSARLEFREGDSGDSRNLLTSAQIAPGGPLGLLGGLRLRESSSGAEERLGFDLRLGLVYRAEDGRWTVLDRLDFVGEDADAPTSSRDSRKLVNNLLGIYRPSHRWQMSVHHGVKYTREIIDGDRYSGWTHLLGGEARRGLGQRWDVGLHGNLLYAGTSRVGRYGYGASVGRQLAHNMWASVGYNAAGIDDRDLDSAGTNRDGLFVKLRMKFDQESVRGLLQFLSGQANDEQPVAPLTAGVSVGGGSPDPQAAAIDPDTIGSLSWFLETIDPDSVGSLSWYRAAIDPDTIGRLRVHVAGTEPSSAPDDPFAPRPTRPASGRVSMDPVVASASVGPAGSTRGDGASPSATVGGRRAGTSDERMSRTRLALLGGLIGAVAWLVALVIRRRRTRRARAALRCGLLVIAFALVCSGSADAEVVSVNVDQDSFLDEGNPTDNFGTDNELKNEKKSGASRRSVFRFDLSAYPSDAVVYSATAYFFVRSSQSTTPIDVHRITDSWTESGVTWNNTAADYDATVLGTVTPSNGTYVGVDLTALVSDWIDGTLVNDGVMLISTDTEKETKFGSRERSVDEVPYLELDYAFNGSKQIDGRVVEDPNGDANLIDGIARSGIAVTLYADGGDGLASGGDDTLRATRSTDASGEFTMDNLVDGTYWLTLDSKQVSPDAGFIGGADLGDVWAEQTHGPDGALCADGTGGTSVRVGAGPCYGGRRGGVSDDATGLSTAEHVAKVVVAGSDISGLDFGFSFDTVTNTRGGDKDEDDDGDEARTIQGGFRQFLVNANSIAGANAMRFAPAVATNASGGGGQWWSLAVIDDLPPFVDSGTTVDGTAYSLSDGVTTRGDNPGSAGVGGAVGVDGLSLGTVGRPELEIVDDNNKNIGLDVQAASVTIRRIAIYGFGDAEDNDGEGNIRVESVSGTIVEDCFIGTSAGGFTDPGAAPTADNIRVKGGTGGTIRDNLIGYGDGNGIGLKGGANGWLIEGNEIRANGLAKAELNGVSIDGSASATVRGNLIWENEGAGIDTVSSTGSNTIENNTIHDNGIGVNGNTETAGIRLFGSSNVVDRNVIYDNYGAGVMVTRDATQNTITRNHVYDNGTILNNASAGPTGQIGIDLLDGGDDDKTGDSPFVTLNDVGDSDNDANGLLNFPVLDTAVGLGNTLTLTGWARPGSTIELFLAEPDGSGFGEGKVYLTTVVEGSVDDTDGSSGGYGPGAINGIAQGQDSTSRFEFLISVPAGVSDGSILTATATRSGATSEFGGVVTVSLTSPEIDVVKIGVTQSDPINAATNPKAIPGATVLYTVTSTNTGNGATDADSVLISDEIPAGTSLFVGDIGTTGSGPVAFADGATSSGLSYSFVSLASTTDDVEFSDDDGASYTYVPTPDGDGFDPAVTDLRVRLEGTYAASNGVDHPSFEVQFKIRVE